MEEQLEEIALFDITNPTDSSKIGSPPTYKEIGLRFAPLREMITNHKATISLGAKMGIEKSEVETVGTVPAQNLDTHSIRWEQMICQLGWNACYLLNRFAPEVLVKPGCIWDFSSNKWISTANQCVDIEIVQFRMTTDDDNYDYYLNDYEDNFINKQEQYILTEEDAFDNANIKSPQLENYKYIMDINDSKDGLLEYKVYINRYGVLFDLHRSLRRFARGKKNPVVFVKVGVPSHYTMALIYLNENRIEFFDSGGTYDVVGYQDDNPNLPYSSTLSRKKTLKSYSISEQCVPQEQTYSTDYAVCQAFSNLFPDFHLVGINSGINLQIDDRDAHCQTWIWLYAYIKFIYPKLSTRDAIAFLQNKVRKGSKTKKQAREALELIESFWSYLLYLERSTTIRGGGNSIDNWIIRNNKLQFKKNTGNNGNWIIKDNKLHYI